jgi:hypothetical protein
MISVAQVPPLPGRERPNLAASIRGRPDQRRRRGEGRAAVDAIQARLGDALLLLAGLAVVLLAIIIVLVEVNVILRLGGKVSERLRSIGADPAEVSADRGPEEERGR